MNKEIQFHFIAGKPYNTKSDVWAIGCVLYEMAALKRAFEAPTLPALILKIMRGVTSPLPAQYGPGARQLLVSLLALEPAKRPSIPEIMSHHWLAPYIFRHLACAVIHSLTSIFRIPTTVGLIPCTAKQNRPVAIEAAQVGTTECEFNVVDKLYRHFAAGRQVHQTRLPVSVHAPASDHGHLEMGRL